MGALCDCTSVGTAFTFPVDGTIWFDVIVEIMLSIDGSMVIIGLIESIGSCDRFTAGTCISDDDNEDSDDDDGDDNEL